MPPKNAKISVNLKEVGLPDSYSIMDLWSGKNLGQFSGEFSPEINLNGAGFYKIVKATK